MFQRQYGTQVVCFFAGVLAGAATALVTAPQAGRRTRRMIRAKVEDGADSVAEAARDLRKEGKELAENAANLVERAAHARFG